MAHHDGHTENDISCPLPLLLYRKIFVLPRVRPRRTPSKVRHLIYGIESSGRQAGRRVSRWISNPSELVFDLWVRVVNDYLH